ncbi:GT-D fold domain-containing glycosyltransferase [Paenibacillus sp. 1001270B_150601_E10]|uniref:GT-D fold domain-containing protein n=1 Tax=Paenibacillus sp. 1001270B_150601_E10 TaxID=2787079 RepID=UPI001E3A2375|nr:GT-D fold domain-containing glycosyltransferase [Paenibacillus sp. 1001270B_150601_E10]
MWITAPGGNGFYLERIGKGGEHVTLLGSQARAKRRKSRPSILRSARVQRGPRRRPAKRHKRGSKRGNRLKKRRNLRGLRQAPADLLIDVEGERQIAFEDGFRKGKYEGGEGFLARLIPEHMILPDIPVEHVIALGFEQVRHLLQTLIDPADIFAHMERALERKEPLSVVRLGDGELLALAHDRVLSSGLVRKEGPFLGYAGIDIPDHEYRDQLANAVRQATFVGIPTSRAPNFQGLMYPTFRAHGMDVRQMRLTYSTVNYMLAQYGFLNRLMQGRRVLVVGNAAEELAAVLLARGIQIAGIITPVMGVRDTPRILAEVGHYSFDLALVAAGIPAVLITQRIASQYGKVALDFGHLANKIASGELGF